MTRTLKRALIRLLRPLIKAMIDAGVTFPSMASLLRELYVDVAKRDYAMGGRPPTFSRLAMLTGIHRKEIKRLATAEPAADIAPSTLSLSARALALWQSDPNYLDDDGQPVPLARTAAKGKTSLDQLIASVSKDVRARTVLEEWCRLGLVELRSEKVYLKQEEVMPENRGDEKALALAANLEGHIAASAHNFTGTKPAFLDSALLYTGMSQSSVNVLQTFCERRSEVMFREVDRQARRIAQRDNNAPDSDARFIFGVYAFAEEAKEGEK